MFLKGRAVDVHTFLALVVFVELHGLEGSSTANQLVGELALVLLPTIDLLVSPLRVVCPKSAKLFPSSLVIYRNIPQPNMIVSVYELKGCRY